MEKCNSVFILYYLYCWKWHFTMYIFLLALLFHAAQFYFLTDRWKIQSVYFWCWVSSITLIIGFSVKLSFGSKLTHTWVSSRTLLASSLIQTSDTDFNIWEIFLVSDTVPYSCKDFKIAKHSPVHWYWNTVIKCLQIFNTT